MSDPLVVPVNDNNTTVDPQEVWVSPLVRAPAVPSKVRKCSRCRLPGHNKKKCTTVLETGTLRQQKTIC